MIVEIDERSGFCFGVVNAISSAEKSISEGERVVSLGDIVHNGAEVERLAALGLETAPESSGLDGLGGRTVLIRAHGEPPATYAAAREQGLRIIDATCPVVARLQKTVAAAYAEMKRAGGQVVIFGRRGHAEVRGLAGQAGNDVIVVEGAGDLDAVDFSRPVYLLSQTTSSLSEFGEVGREILRRAADPAAVTIHDTVCRQVSNREEHLARFASRFDVVVFVAGAKSSNGRVLFEAVAGANPRARKIENASQLRPEWFAGQKSAGVCGATSTPRWLMEEVARAIESYQDVQA